MSSPIWRTLVACGLTALLVTACGGEDPAAEGDADGGAGTGESPSPEAAGEQGDGGEPAGETISWDYMMVLPVSHLFTQRAEAFADEVRERTDGQLDITVRPAGELPYGPDEFLRRTGDGSVALSQAPSTFIAGDCAIAGLPALPFLLTSIEELQAAESILEPYLNDCFEQRGARLLYWNYFPNQQFWGGGEAVTSLDGLSGLQIRQTGAEYAALIELLGAEPVTLTTPEVAPAIQRGVMDALITAGLTVTGSQWHEFLEWGYLIDMGLPPDYILISQEAYEGLPEDVGATLDEIAAEFQGRAVEENQATEQESLDVLETEHGLTLTEASEEDTQRATELMTSYWEEWAQERGEATLGEALAEVREAVGK